MILDYNYNKYTRNFEISYVTKTGGKQLLTFNVQRFKSYYYTPDGAYTSWDGAKCDVQYVEKPSKFDLKTFITEMDPEYKALITQKTFPKMYTFDIEAAADKHGVFSAPNVASEPITTISCVSPEFRCIVMGWKPLSKESIADIKEKFNNYLHDIKFFNDLKITTNNFEYIEFASEKDMLSYFLKNIVAKVPVLAGWNNILYDWQYITTRITHYYPDISLKDSSMTRTLQHKQYIEANGDKVYLPVPNHTLLIDMMDVIDEEETKVSKESMSLEYISHEAVGVGKIEYEGTLDDLWKKDYDKYVYYNSIDSILVQLINLRYRTMNHIYLYSLYTNEKIGSCFSKIALTEALVFNDFYKNGLKIVYQDDERPERGKLVGAYVKKPIPGIHEWVCCNDFASLYPSTIRTCNLSFENYVTAYWLEDELDKYRYDTKYVVVGPNVFKNKGTAKSPEIGEQIGSYVDWDACKKYKNDPSYFVSVNGCIYKNDKDYTFRRVQGALKNTRDHDKYLAKQLDATVMTDIAHIMRSKEFTDHEYKENIVAGIANIGYAVTSTVDLRAMMECGELERFRYDLNEEINYLENNEQAMKLMMNSMYGGCSHVAFYWYNMNVANDITGESRNLIHKMEHHIPEFWAKNWEGMTDVHKMLGIEVDHDLAMDALDSCPVILDDPDAYHDKSFVSICYGDTDSLYISYDPLIHSIKGHDKMSVEQKRDILAKLNTEFMDGHNSQFIKEYYDTRFGKSAHNFELEVILQSCVWLEVKKRYAGIELWKDGKIFDLDDLPMKIKGLEMVKTSFPRLSRKHLTDLVRYLLTTVSEPYLIQRLNMKTRNMYDEFMNADVELISGSVKVNGYKKYCVSDSGEYPVYRPGVTWNVRALGMYNWLSNKYNLKAEYLTGGKFKWYQVKSAGIKSKNSQDEFFAFVGGKYPQWAEAYAPIDRRVMFQKTILDPFNRILTSNKLPLLHLDGEIQVSLFD